MQKEVNADYLLWKRVKAGETQAFHELYMQYADILFSFGLVYTKDQEFVKDCIHDLFFELFKYRKNLADHDQIRNYLFKSFKRKVQTGKIRKLNLVYSDKIQDEKSKKNLAENIEESEEEEENILKIRRSITKLSDRQKEALNLRFQVGLSYPEVADILGISVESTRTLVYRTVKTIREELHIKSGKLILLFILKGAI